MKHICKRKSSIKVFFTLVSMSILLFLSGCGPSLSSTEQVQQFDRVGAIRRMQTEQEQVKSKYDCVYHIKTGDVLKLTMPVTLQEMSWESARRASREEPYFCRVDRTGNIALPIVGLVPVAGKSPSEVEAVIVDTHYPKYVTQPPAVVCDIEEHYNERNFAIMGLVRKPDSFEYPPNARFTLTDAMAMAGGTDIIADPHYATIYRQDSNGEIVTATFKIDRANLAQASKVLIEPGDIVSIDSSLRTNINRTMDRLMHFGVGASVTP